MAEVRLPATLGTSVAGAPRAVRVDAATVGDAVGRLDALWPGLRDRLCVPGPRLRPHIRAYVDGRGADLDTPLSDGSRVDIVAAITGG